MIGYSNHSQITQSNVSLDSSRFLARGSEVNFVNCHYLVSLIIGQNCYSPNVAQTKQSKCIGYGRVFIGCFHAQSLWSVDRMVTAEWQAAQKSQVLILS